MMTSSPESPDRERALASVTDRQAIPGDEPRLEQAEKAQADADVVPVSPVRSRPWEARSRRRQRRGRRGQPTVLVVDDEEPVRETLVEVLSLHGYRVVTAASVEEAEAAKQRLGAAGIQLVIVDVHLTPGPQARAGYVLAQRWRAQQPTLPLLLISGDPSIQDLPEVQAGALRVVLKPFRLDAFLATVREALSKSGPG